MKPCLFLIFPAHRKLSADLTYCTICWHHAATSLFFCLKAFWSNYPPPGVKNIDVWAWLYSALFNLLFEVERLLKTLRLPFVSCIIQTHANPVSAHHVGFILSSAFFFFFTSFSLHHSHHTPTLHLHLSSSECTLFSFWGEKQEGEPRHSDAQLHTRCRLMEGRRDWAQAASHWLAGDVQLLRSTTCHS